MKRWLRTATTLILLAGALYLLDLDALGLALRKVSIGVAVLSILITLVGFTVMGLRWYWIIQPLAPLPLVDHLKYYFYATFLNTFTPANVGGDVYRAVSLRAHAPCAVAVLVALVRERLLGLLCYLLACVLLLVGATISGFVPRPGLPPLFVYAGVAAAVASVAIVAVPYIVTGPLMRLPLVKRRRTLATAVGLLDQASRFGSWPELAILLAYSGVGVALWIGAVILIALDLGLTVSWAALGVVVVLTELLRMLPITIQGIGLREGLFAYLLAALGYSPETGFVLGLISYTALTCALIVCGLVGWILLYYERRTNPS